MSFPSFHGPSGRLVGFDRTRATWAGLCVGGAILAGAAAADGLGIYAIAGAATAAAVVAAIKSWRRSLVWMLLYLPLSGIIPLLEYPNSTPGVLLKDVLFVVPAYIGAIVAGASRRERFKVPGLPVILLACLSLLILVQAFNPHLPRPLVGPIGIRVWLFYLPLIVLGYHLFDRREQLQKALKVMLALAMIPCGLGIIEAMFVYNGHASEVFRLYGAASSAATQDFTAFDFGLTRIPSIFTFIAQYWLFSTATVAVGYAAWRGNRGDPTMAWFGPIAIGVAALASLTSGARAAFIFTPFLLVLIALLEGVRASRLVKYVAVSAIAVVVSLEVLNIGAGPLASSTTAHTSFIFSFFGDGLHFAERHLIGASEPASTPTRRATRSATPAGQQHAGTAQRAEQPGARDSAVAAHIDGQRPGRAVDDVATAISTLSSRSAWRYGTPPMAPSSISARMGSPSSPATSSDSAPVGRSPRARTRCRTPPSARAPRRSRC